MTAPSLSLPRSRLTLGVKLSVGLILIIGILFSGLNAYMIYSSRKVRLADARALSTTIGGLIVGAITNELGQVSVMDDESPLESARMRTFVANFLGSVFRLQSNRDIAYAVVLTNDNKVVVGKARPQLTVFPGNKVHATEEAALEAVAALDGRLGGDMDRTGFNLKLSGDSAPVGKLLVGTSLARIQRQMRRDVAINIGVMGAALLVLIIYSSLTLRSLVTRPLRMVVDAMRSVHDGSLDKELNIRRRDEIGALAHTYNFMVQGLREREKLKDAFNRYVSESVYKKFQAGEITLTGENRVATVLFSDIRSFTTLSEQLTPQQVVAMLNEYFTEMVEIVFKYDGFVNKFIGDALMAIYNIPVTQSQPELRCVRTGLEMVQALDRLNARREARGDFPIKIGIGINTGPVVAGNIGHEKRLEYTVIGDAVNLAQRIESQTKVAGATLLISETTYAAVADEVIVEELPPVKVKGKAEPVKLYAVTAVKHPDAPIASLPA